MAIKISVLLPVYNAKDYLPQAISSLIKQTFQDFEVVMVNDASTDTSLEIMTKAKKMMPNVTIVSYDKNRTLPGALNEGLKNCKGEYIFRLDADDWLDATCLEKEYRFLQDHPDYDGVISDELKVDEHQQPVRLLLKLGDDYYIKKQNLFRTAFGGPTLMLKKEKFYDAGLHDERAKVSSDRLLGIKLHHISKIGHIPERLYYYREHEKNISQNNTLFKKKSALYKYEKHLYKGSI